MQRAANVWDRFYRYQESPWRGESLVADLLPHLGAGPVLELGCGNGKTLRPLLAAGVDVVGVDVSWNVLRGLRGAQRVLADAAALPWADASFTAVLDLHCTGHLLQPGRKEASREIARVLVPGGRLVSERLAPDDVRSRTGEPAGEPGTQRLADGRTTHFSDEADLRGEFEGAGLAREATDLVRREISHRGEPVLRSAVRVRFSKQA